MKVINNILNLGDMMKYKYIISSCLIYRIIENADIINFIKISNPRIVNLINLTEQWMAAMMVLQAGMLMSLKSYQMTRTERELWDNINRDRRIRLFVPKLIIKNTVNVAIRQI